jgi:ribonuclease D
VAYQYQWVADTAALEQVVAEAAVAPAYALDTEFHRERTYYPHLALVQLAWDGQVALVDPLAVDLGPLARLLDGPGTAVLHAADQDLEVLDRACGTVPARLFDTQVAAGFVGYSTPALSQLVERLAKVRLPKGDRISDWTERPLTAEQLDYAAADVAHLPDVHRQLVAQLEGRGRLVWAEDECERLRARSRQPQDPDTAWWRVKESRSLRGRARGVAQAVAAWREREAAASDRPPRFVLPDLALLAIAHRPPADVAELRRIRGLDGRHLAKGVDKAILRAVEEGAALAPSALRLPPVDDLERRLRPAVALAAAWTGQLASDLSIDPALLATRSDLLALLRGDPDCRLATGWRAELAGEPIRRLVSGEAALAFDGRGGLLLEDRGGPTATP